MSFKYINPGYKDLLNVKYPNNVKNVTPTPIQSKTGVAFYNAGGGGNWIASFTDISTSEIWAKFDVFIPQKSAGSSKFASIFTFGHYYIAEVNVIVSNSYSNNSYIKLNSRNNTLYSISCQCTENEKTLGIILGTINTIWIHIKFGSEDASIFDVKINNQLHSMPSKNFPYASSTEANISLYTEKEYTDTLFSNIILSDEEISPTETIVLLPVSETLTNMSTLEGGLYVADSAGKTLLQSADISPLVKEYGSDTNVTGIVLIGNHAYNDSQELGAFTALTKNNNVIQEHDKIFCTTDSDSVIFSSFAMSTETTIADLANMQFGWRS